MPEIHRWQYQYLGLSEFPKALSPVELQAFFTLNEAEIGLIRSRYKSDLRVAAAIQLGFLKMTGSPLEALRVIPAKLLKHVASQLGVPSMTIASLRAIYKREKTLYDHQWWAQEVLGFKRAKPAHLGQMKPFLLREAAYIPTIDLLVARGKLWLYQHRFLAVADRTLRDMARRAMAESEEGLLKLVYEQVSEPTVKNWENAVLRPREGSGRSTLEWLQQPPRRQSIVGIRDRLTQIEFLKKLRAHELNLDGIAIEKIRAYGMELHAMRPAKYRELKNPTRTIRLVCFLKMALMQATDTAILMGGRQVAKLVRHAYDKAQLLEAEAAISHRDILLEIYEKVDDKALTDTEFRDLVRTMKKKHQPAQFSTRAAAARWLLSDPNPPLRNLLSELRKLDLEAEPENPVPIQVDFLSGLYKSGRTALPDGASVPYPATWKDLIEGPDRERAMRALEACTLVGLRKTLKSGAVYVDHSEKFRGRHKLLIDEERWAKERKQRYGQLNLPLDVDELLNRLTKELEDRLQALGEAAQDGRITLQNGIIHFPKVKAQAKKPEVDRKRDQLFKKIGTIQLPELILQADVLTGFSRAILGRPARTQAELLQLYAGMIAHGTVVDASAISLMVPQLTQNQILAGMQIFEDRDLIRNANDVVAGYQRRLPIAAAWGDGSLVSSDMMSMDVSRQVWVARMDPKRKTASVGTYTTLADFWSIIYDQPIVLNERQAGAAIEGAIRQTEFEVDRLAVDTHGYTEFAMAIAKLLGFALCPRLKRLSERKLYIPRDMKNVPECLKDVVSATVSLPKIRLGYDDLVRVAASIETGHSTATIALARFGSASADSPIYQAGVQLGRLIRSIYLCDYFLSEDLRRMINRILVHGEAVHQLQRAINAGNFAKPRGQREDELYAISGSLTLLSNLCLAWTAHKIQEYVAGDGMPSDEDVAWIEHVSPAHFSNINFRGTFSFPISDYRELLMPKTSTVYPFPG